MGKENLIIDEAKLSGPEDLEVDNFKAFSISSMVIGLM